VLSFLAGEQAMSVRATGRLIGDIVIVPALPKSPQMVAKAFNAETNLITTSWFSDTGVYQEGTFPATALARVEPKSPPNQAKPRKAEKRQNGENGSRYHFPVSALLRRQSLEGKWKNCR
jgi:hypothetical protein